jgi:peroxiredoxin
LTSGSNERTGARGARASGRQQVSFNKGRRPTVKRISCIAPIILIGIAARISGQTAPVDSAALVKTGQVPPDFTVTTLEGRVFNPAAARGSVVLLNFFATWCTACKMELPDLQKNIWEPFKKSGLVVLCIGREHTREELEKFRRENGYTLDFAPDPDREIFKKFAAKNIPRNILIGKDGTVIHQSLGYNPEEFNELAGFVARALKE